jgi:hypothetical protein
LDNYIFEKNWGLGALGFVGFYKIPVVFDSFQGNESIWEVTNLLWFFWFLYFIPKSYPNKLLNVKNLSKNWKFHKNTLYGFSQSQSKKETANFMYLSINMRFKTFSEGKCENGCWKFNLHEKKIILLKKNKNENLIVKKLTNKELVLMIENPSNKKIKIHFKN